jgi:glyoxylase-like metal-dependent hydrolase (beta-lactamase superfamily II)
VTRTFEAAPGIIAIDTRMFERENVTSAYLVTGPRPSLVETGSATVADEVREGLRSLGVGPDDLAHIVVTHIHLDHAGGAGTLAPHFPSATVWVHERGAPHLADPTRLTASAERIYGKDGLRRLFGPVEPVPEDRLRALTDMDSVDLGDGRSLTALHTPGHASHHVTLLDSETGGAFVGDALGVFLPDVQILRPATPPPEFDLEQAIRSIERIRDVEPSRILFSHFGPVADVEHVTTLAITRLERWTGVVEEALEETDDPARVTELLREGTAMETNPADADEGRRAGVAERYELLSSYEMNAMGIMRYLRKKQEAGRA